MACSKRVVVISVLAALTFTVLFSILLSSYGIISSEVSSDVSIVAAIAAIGAMYALIIRKTTEDKR
jgi:hypothetical protein